MDLFGTVQRAPSYDTMNAGQQYAMFMFCAKMAAARRILGLSSFVSIIQ